MKHLTVILACAWILWVHDIGRSNRSYLLVKSFDSKQQCEKFAEQKQSKIDETSRSFGGGKAYLKCFPDTVNPNQ
jgi:hypothetical protein